MSQAWLIAVRETTELRRDGRLRALVLLAFVLTAAAGAGGTLDRARTARERTEAQQAERDRWLSQGEVNPHAAAHYGTFVFRPVEPLAALDPGLLPFVGSAIFLEAHQQQLARHRPVDATAPPGRFGTLTPARCLQVLLPLLILLIGHATWAGERERGTWPLLVAAGASRGAIAAGKLIGLSVPLVPMLGVPGCAGLAALVSSGDGLDREQVVRAAAMGLAYAMYAATWLAAVVAVSAAARSPRQALAALVGAWLATCLMAPPVAMSLAALWAPGPATTAFQVEVDEARAARPGWDARVDAATERFLNGEDLPPASNPEVVALIEAEEDDTAIFAAAFERLAARFEQQRAVYQWAGVVSPMLAVQAVSMSMAATDYAHIRHFDRAAAAYRTELLAALNRELAAFDGWKTFNAAGSRDLWARVPEFAYDTPPAGWALAGQRTGFLALAGWLLAASTAAVICVMRAAPA